MLWTLALILLIFWAVGFAFKVAGVFIHLLLIIALIVFVLKLFARRKNRPDKAITEREY